MKKTRVFLFSKKLFINSIFFFVETFSILLGFSNKYVLLGIKIWFKYICANYILSQQLEY